MWSFLLGGGSQFGFLNYFFFCGGGMQAAKKGKQKGRRKKKKGMRNCRLHF
jgi:hypothetical protein